RLFIAKLISFSERLVNGSERLVNGSERYDFESKKQLKYGKICRQRMI
ncbi:unnamed protein product, partial [marine sediment metagenome]